MAVNAYAPAMMKPLVIGALSWFAFAAMTAVAAAQDPLRIPLDQVAWRSTETLPKGFLIGMLREDPGTKARAVLVKFPKGGRLPPHWHTAAEQVVVIQGTLRVTGADGTKVTLKRGGYAYTPGKTVHATACESKGGCLVYSATDGPFDLVRVNEQGTPLATP